MATDIVHDNGSRRLRDYAGSPWLSRIKRMNFKDAEDQRAARAAKTAGVDGLLVTHLPDVRYLCGFTGSNAALVLTGGKSRSFYRWAIHGAGEGGGRRERGS